MSKYFRGQRLEHTGNLHLYTKQKIYIVVDVGDMIWTERDDGSKMVWITQKITIFHLK